MGGRLPERWIDAFLTNDTVAALGAFSAEHVRVAAGCRAPRIRGSS